MATRITQNTMSFNYMQSLQKSTYKQNKITSQLASGKQIQRPSDDPVKTVRSLKFNSSLGQNEQYIQNLKDAQSWMQSTESAVSDFGEMLTQIKESVVRASNQTNPEMAMQATGREIDNIINQMVSVGNTQVGDRYVFAGQKDKTQPFTRDEVTGEVTYHGDNGKISMVIQGGASATPTQDSVNLTGVDVFGEDGVKVLNQLNDIRNKLMEGTQDAQDWLQKDGLQILDDAKDFVLQSHTALGARMETYELNLNMMENNSITITSDLSLNEDIDMAQATMDLKVIESIYKAALSAGSRILPPSLVDYLN